MVKASKRTIKAVMLGSMLLILLSSGLFLFGCGTHEHRFGDWVVEVAASCTNEGVAKRVCVSCEHVQSEILPKLAHAEIIDEGYDATCTREGLSAGVHCAECGTVILEQRVLPKLAHTETIDEGYDATCTREGLSAGVHCAECGTVILEQKTLHKTAHIAVTDSAVPATFESTGLTEGTHCEICQTVIVPRQVTDRLLYEDFAYTVTFDVDENVSVFVYESQDYTQETINTNVAYSRSGDNGELLMNGDGQVNFKLAFNDGYVLDDIIITSGYKNLKLPGETDAENTYRITKIEKNLTVIIRSQKQMSLSQFASYTDENGLINFSWQADDDIKYIKAEISADGEKSTVIIDGKENKWQYMAKENARYYFEFTPYNDNKIEGNITSCSRFYAPSAREITFPRVEIFTQNYVWPTCDYVLPPPGGIGQGITNNRYNQCIINVYNQDNECLYTSSDCQDYSAAKIKIRGNTSAYSEKKPYKIKLAREVDLLAELLPDRADKSYAHKEWLLLNTGNSINSLAGFSVSETLQMAYSPAYSYVECYVNGDFRGLYILCESVSRGNGIGDEQTRCAVDDDGFIVELDAYWWNESLSFETDNTVFYMRYTFKYPDADDITEQSPEFNYIKNYILKFEEALSLNDDSYSDYIDEESFAKWLLAHDILATMDAGGSNIYVTKKDSSDMTPLEMPLIWDCDSAFSQNGIYSLAEIRNYRFFYYKELLQKQSFTETYNRLFAQVKNEIITGINLNANRVNAEAYNSLISIENERWTDVQCENYNAQMDKIIYWLQEHINFMSDNCAL